jgi:hypothetical protein
MHLKSILETEKTLKLSLGKYMKKTPKNPKKHQKTPKIPKNKNPLGWFFLNPGFFQPCLLHRLLLDEGGGELDVLVGNDGDGHVQGLHVGGRDQAPAHRLHDGLQVHLQQARK